ncbi:MAG: hypothetical protein B7Y39_07090 [Bdellovibrio sp. 28-41-41]|nr:MAG: hypothetical protein B7Y39_07090 [Bdellovibrio sp. 28-41-41]
MCYDLNSSGFSLVEVLVSLMVMMISSLAIFQLIHQQRQEISSIQLTQMDPGETVASRDINVGFWW